jgi:tetratricopeptide (TPR) repeat protein
MAQALQALCRYFGMIGEAMQAISDKDLVDSCLVQATTDDPEQTIVTLEKLMSIRPELKQLHVGLATAYLRAKDFKNAQKHIDLARKKKLFDPRALDLLQGKILWEQGRRDYAVSFMRGGKSHADAATEMAIAQLYTEIFDYLTAEIIYRQLIERNPKHSDAYQAYVSLLIKGDKYEFARTVIETARVQLPDDILIFQLALNVYYLQGDFALLEQEAIAYLQDNPEADFAIHLLTQALWEMGRAEDALAVIEKNRAIVERYPLLKITEASIYRSRGDIDGCKEILDQARALNIKVPKALWNMGLLDLSCGNIKAGFEQFGLRFEVAINTTEPRQFASAQLWQGQALAAGEKLMIWREQGVGDVIAYASLLNEIPIAQNQLILEVDPKLAPLFQTSFPEALVRTPRYNKDYVSVNEDYHHQMPIGSLMPLYRQQDSDFDRQPTRYLEPDSTLKATYGQWFTGLSRKPKIGICWRSRRTDGVRSKHYYELSDLVPMFNSVDADFVSLQYDSDVDERDALFGEHSIRVYRHPHLDQFDDIAGTAAFIDNLDFVVTVGTAVQNISGGLGKPTIVLGLKGGYWFFGRDRKNVFTQPVHPNSHVFGRTLSEPKQAVIENAAAYLRSFFMFIGQK